MYLVLYFFEGLQQADICGERNQKKRTHIKISYTASITMIRRKTKSIKTTFITFIYVFINNLYDRMTLSRPVV